MVDLSRSKLPPYRHQVEGVEFITKWNDPAMGRHFGGCFFLADDMGLGKTKQVIDSFQYIFSLGPKELHGIDRILVVAPGAIRPVWFDPDLGELANHLWDGLPVVITEFHAHTRVRATFDHLNKVHKHLRRLDIVVTNYEFIRSKERLNELIPFCNDRTWLVCDESSGLKNHKSQQTKAVLKLRERCSRVTLMNGTPISNHLGDLYSQFLILDRRILGARSYTQFLAEHAIRGGWQNKQILGWRKESIELIQKRIAPYILRRLKEDCTDLPPKLPPKVVLVPLDTTTWKLYKQMRDDLVAEISAMSSSIAPQAIIKVMRLAQITSGFIGGVEDLDYDPDTVDTGPERPDRPSFIDPIDFVDYTLPFDAHEVPLQKSTGTAVREIGREKMDAFFREVDIHLEADPKFKLITFSCFTPELERAARETKARYPDAEVGIFAGGNVGASFLRGTAKERRLHATRLLNPATTPDKPCFVFANERSGGVGQNFTAAHTMFRLSFNYSLYLRKQGNDRIHRIGQTKPVTYVDFLATGPKGQKTINHTTFAALQKKDDLATMTQSAWIRLLEDEG